MRVATVIAGLGAIAMIAVIAYGILVGDFGGEGRRLLAMPWGMVSLFDLYVGFLLFCGWILYRQGSSVRPWLWILLVLTLGSLGICLYVLTTLRASQGDWRRFFMEKREEM